MLTTDNLTRVDPAPGDGPDPDHGLEDGLGLLEDQVQSVCLTPVSKMGPVSLLSLPCLSLMYQC